MRYYYRWQLALGYYLSLSLGWVRLYIFGVCPNCANFEKSGCDICRISYWQQNAREQCWANFQLYLESEYG